MGPGSHLGYYYASTNLLEGKYSVGLAIETDDHLKWQIKNLIEYGNTVSHGTLEENLQELEEMGFECTYSKMLFKYDNGMDDYILYLKERR